MLRRDHQLEKLTSYLHICLWIPQLLKLIFYVLVLSGPVYTFRKRFNQTKYYIWTQNNAKLLRVFFLKAALPCLFSLKAGDDLNRSTFSLHKFQTVARERESFALATYLVKSTAVKGSVFKTVSILNNALQETELLWLSFQRTLLQRSYLQVGPQKWPRNLWGLGCHCFLSTNKITSEIQRSEIVARRELKTVLLYSKKKNGLNHQHNTVKTLKSA